MLSNALNMKLDYFFRPFAVAIDTYKFEFRKKASIGAKKVESIKFLVCSEIEKHLEIETLLGIITDFRLDYSNTVVESEDEAKLHVLAASAIGMLLALPPLTRAATPCQ